MLLAATRAEELKAKPNSMIQALLQDSATTRYIHYTTCIDQGIQRTRTTSVLASFRHSSTSVYYTKPKPNNKNGGGLGMRLRLYHSLTSDPHESPTGLGHQSVDTSYLPGKQIE